LVGPRLTGFVTFVLVASLAPAATAGTRTDHVILIRARPSVGVTQLQAQLAARGLSVSGHVPHTRLYAVRTNGQSTAAAVDLAADENGVAEAMPNYVRHAFEVPNDPYFELAESYFTTIRLPQAWDLSHGSPGFVIAVLDTGVAPVGDLSAQLLAGRNMVAGTADARDDSLIGHGTLVAGVAAATTNNGLGIAGAAWNANVLPVKVLDSRGFGTDFQVAAGIVWAVDHGAKVLNLSLGGPYSGAALCDAVAYAVSHGAVVVASAGNSGSDSPNYPAACPGALSVSATDSNGDFASFSSFGPQVGLAAPGISITSTRNDGSFGNESGTSFSAPMVSAVAALVMAQHPDWSPSQVDSRLEDTTQDRGPAGADPYYGSGLLDAYAALGGPRQDPVIATGDNLEPNDTPADADSLWRSTTATISPEGDVDWYLTRIRWPCVATFHVDGAPYDTHLGPNFQPILQLYDEDQNLLAASDDYQSGHLRLALHLPAGRYLLRLANKGGARSPGAYSISFTTTRLHHGAGLLIP